MQHSPSPRIRPGTGALPFALLLALSLGSSALADGPEDNHPENVRPIPPPGIEVPAEKAGRLEQELAGLEKVITGLENSPEHADLIASLLPDVEVCHKAVRDALRHGEFHKPAEIDFAFELLALGRERAARLRAGEAPWTRQAGKVVRGYRSRIDGSVQPYGLEIPESYDFDSPSPTRLDFWFHGRGEKLSEVSFLQQRHLGRAGKISPPDTIVLHPYGRYSNANKFAGEADLFEALEHARRDYRVDEDRILVRGFSMGGAACWQFAVHYAGMWAAAQPGAGFSETPDFLETFQGETLAPTWWEEKLWRWYDATHWAVNLTNTPTIAYSGEIDRQKQAADMMVAAADREGFDLLHLVGPETAHKFHPDTLVEIESRLASIARAGRDPVPETVRFVTFTLRYDRMHWVRVDALTEHWEEGRIVARIDPAGAGIEVTTSGIDAFSLHFPAGRCPLDPVGRPILEIDGKELEAPRVPSDRSWEVFAKRLPDGWSLAASPFANDTPLVKRHGLQGPIDDAFTGSFLMVSPTGKPRYDLVGEWTHSERSRALDHWRLQFRGDARVKKDRDVGDEDIAAHHLVLWGDPSGNRLLDRVLSDLPVDWTEEKITVGDRTFDSRHHVLAMVYPNPLNPDRYVVLNSGFTYREYDYLNNARQTPKLPDWAVIDLREPPSTRYPGKVVAAGFFDEAWQIQPDPGK